MKLDPELESLARHALIDAFWTDFGGLVNAYMEAAEGLDKETFLCQVQERTSVFIRSAEKTDVFINLYGELPSGGSCGYSNFTEAFEDERATTIYLQGVRVFCRDELDQWMYCGDDE